MNNGWTPLMIACVRGHDNIIRDALKIQFNINHHTSIGITALHLSSHTLRYNSPL